MVPNFFHLRMMETTVLLGTVNAAAIFCTLPQICASTQSCLGALRTIPSTSWLGFCSDTHCQLLDFPNHVQSIELTTGGLQSSCRNIPRMINGNRMHMSSLFSLIAKGLKRYVNKVFLFYIFYTFEKKSRKLFSLCHYGVLCVD